MLGLAFFFFLLTISIADPALNGENELRKTAENSLLKGKKDYSEIGDEKGDVEFALIGGIVGGQETLEPMEYNLSKQESTTKSEIVVDLLSSDLVPFSSSSTNGTEAHNKEGEQQQQQQNNQNHGRRLFDSVRVRQCLGWCLATLPPWYSDLAKVNCNRTNECEKAPENGAQCKQRCNGIVKDLPIRPVLSCPYFCDLAYGGLEKTLQFCKSKCPP